MNKTGSGEQIVFTLNSVIQIEIFIEFDTVDRELFIIVYGIMAPRESITCSTG